MIPDLNVLLSYQNPRVVNSFIRDTNVSEEKAVTLFQDVLRYLWITKKHAIEKNQFPEKEELQFTLVMHEEMREIDNMWHNFILYTHDYMIFCEKYFGEYLHHQRDMIETMEKTNAGFSEDLEKYLSYIYDHLGQDILKRWFACYLN